MTFELTGPAKGFETIRKVDGDGAEYWEARELMPLLGYAEWRKFTGVIGKAIESCKVSQEEAFDHFVGADKMINIATGSQKETQRSVQDYKLSRYACYLIAQNGDPRKQEIALAQTYFAIQTRKQELFDALSPEEKRLKRRGEVSDHNKQLFSAAKQHGVENFGKFNNAGYLGLYGLTTEKIKKKKKIGKDDILDRAGAVELAANLFRITQTEDILKNNLDDGERIGEESSGKVHFHVGQEVRNTIKRIGGTMPEELPTEEHIKTVKKKIGHTNKKQLSEERQ